MDAPLEPHAGLRLFSTECNGLHYVWRGEGPGEKATTIRVYDVQTESWTLRPTTGPPPPGVHSGGCAVTGTKLYCFGGFDGLSRFNDLHVINLETYKWTNISSRQDQSEQPICKEGCGFVPVDETTLVCFGGYGKGRIQPGSIFTGSMERGGWTNELHLFSLKEGVWSSPQLKGERPPPCSDFTFTKVDQERAVLFGGYQPGYGEVNDFYLLNLRNMEVTKVEPGHPWPVGRAVHGACVLNYNDNHPQLLVFGGVDNGLKVLNDMWLLDVTRGRWTEVTPPESLKRRSGHSITSTCLGPGLSEVLVFGGQLAYTDDPIAETTILRFERSQSVTGPPTEKWALMDVATNKTRGSSQRLREKREKIRQATHRPSSESSKGKIIFPINWTVVSDRETNRPVYQNSDSTEVTSTPPGYPLCQTPLHPGVTFYGEPQEREIPSTGGHADFNNGVEVTIPPHTITPGSTLRVKVQPGFASRDVFAMPEGIQSASPSYLISCDNPAGLNGEVTVTMEHHVDVSTREEADDLVFLQADPTPSEGGVYKYQEVSEGRSEFTPGELQGKLITRSLSEKFLKIGSKVKKWFRRSRPSTSSSPDEDPLPLDSPPPDRNLYTVRVYQSPPQTVEDRLAVIFVSLTGRLYEQFLDTLDKVMIPRDYPEVSTRVADRIVFGSICFENQSTVLTYHSPQGWNVQSLKKMISQSEANRPETEKFNPADLHDYPPRIACSLYPEENAPKVTTCCMSLTGLKPEVEFYIPLKAPKPKVGVDTTKLQTATEQLRHTVLSVSHTQLDSTVKNIIAIMSLMERMTEALRSSSLSDLTVHIDSIKTEVETVVTVSRRVAKECTRQTIKEAIEINLSKMEMLSHQLCHVAKVKLKYCQDKSEETAALVDLVESGASLLTKVDCLLRDMRTLSAVAMDGSGSEALTIEALQRKNRISDAQLDMEIRDQDLPYLAGCFDEVETYIYSFNLTPAQQTDIKDLAIRRGTTVAMTKVLRLWHESNPYAATFKALLSFLLDLRKGNVAKKVCKVVTNTSV